MSAARIDVHQHIVPPFYAAELPAHGGDPSGTIIPDWSPQKAVDFMDSQEIETGVLSLTAPGVVRWYKAQRREMARRVNDYTADLVARHPDRFGHFATLPLPDVDGALQELAHAFDVLGADGLMLLANYGGRYLGDDAFTPIWAELDRRAALVFVHPNMPPVEKLTGVDGPLVDYPFDTTRTAVQLVLNGVTRRHPNIRFILAHAGGFLPYVSHRVTELTHVFRSDTAGPDELLSEFMRFYLDTALSSGPAVMPSLKAFAGTGRILFGSDYPYAPAAVSSAFTRKLDAESGLTPEERQAINRGNAVRLLPRLLRAAA